MSKENIGIKEIESYMDRYYSDLNEENAFVGDFLFKHAKGKVLDFGCGPSLFYWALFMQKASCIDGFDILSDNIEYVQRVLNRERKPRVYTEVSRHVASKLLPVKKSRLEILADSGAKIGRLEIANVLKPLPFDREAYDCVTEIGCIGCVDTRGQLVEAAKNMYAHLKKCGKAVIVNWPTTSLKKEEGVPYFDGRVRISKRIFENVFQGVGFRDVNIALRKDEQGIDYSTMIYGTAAK